MDQESRQNESTSCRSAVGLDDMSDKSPGVDFVCIASVDGEYVGGVGFETLAELVAWVGQQKRANPWVAILTAGWYEVTLSELRRIADLRLKLRGAGVRGVLATTIRVCVYGPDDLEEICRIVRKLDHNDVTVEV